MGQVEVLGVGISCIDLDGLLGCVRAWSQRREERTILYVNAHCLNTAVEDPEYKALLNQADLVYADGIGVVLAGRLLGGCSLHKLTGADWIDDFASWAHERSCGTTSGLRVYILAGRPGVARRAAANLQKRYPCLQIVGARDGFFQELSEREVLEEISATSPHVLFVGMGVPRQEKWLGEHRTSLGVPVCWAVGAMFDYVAGLERRAPGWLCRLGMEWFWRLLIDPAGKWKRYLLGNPQFVYRVLRQKLSLRARRKAPEPYEP